MHGCAPSSPRTFCVCFHFFFFLKINIYIIYIYAYEICNEKNYGHYPITSSVYAMEVFSQFLNDNIGSSLYLLAQVNSGPKTCTLLMYSREGLNVRVPPLEEPQHPQEACEKVNATVLALQHFVMRGKLKDAVRHRIDNYMRQIPDLLSVIISPESPDLVRLNFALTLPIRLSIHQIWQALGIFTNWMPTLIFSDTFPDFPPVPAALKPYLSWNSRLQKQDHDEVLLLPDEYPGVHGSPVFSSVHLFIEDAESLQLLDEFPTAKALICDWDVVVAAPPDQGRCGSIGCMALAVVYGGLCDSHSTLSRGYGVVLRHPVQPYAAISAATGGWQAKCPVSILPAIESLRIVRCICGIPLIVTPEQKRDASTLCSACTKDYEDLPVDDIVNTRRLERLFSVLTGLTAPPRPPPRDRDPTDPHDDDDEDGASQLFRATILMGVSVHEEEEDKNFTGSDERLHGDVSYLSDIMSLLGLPRPNLQTLLPLPRWAHRRLVYHLNGVPLSEIGGRLGDWIRAAMFKEFSDLFEKGKETWDGVDQFKEVRKAVILLGAAGALASRSEKLRDEHAHLSRACAASCLVINQVLRHQPVGLCFEDSVLRLAQMYEVLHESKSWGEELLSDPESLPRCNDSTGHVLLSSEYSLSRLIDQENGLAKFPLSVATTNEGDSDEKVAKVKQHNKLAALHERPFPAARISASMAQIDQDMSFTDDLIRRVRAAQVANGLARDEICGTQFGASPSLSVLRDLLRKTGFLKTSRMRGHEGSAFSLAYQAILSKRGSMLKDDGVAGVHDSANDPVSILHRVVHPMTCQSLAYLPQDLKTTHFGPFGALRDPLNSSLDMVGGYWKTGDNDYPACWFLSSEGPGIKLPAAHVNIYWRRCPGATCTPLEQQIASRLLLLKRALDPRLYTPFGPILSRPIASFLLRVSRAFIGDEDIALKIALSRDYEESLCLTWEENVSRLHLRAALHGENVSQEDEHGMIDEEPDRDLDGTLVEVIGKGILETAREYLLDMTNLSSIYGARVPQEHIIWSPEAQMLCPPINVEVKGHRQQEDQSEVQAKALEDAAFIRDIDDEMVLKTAHYRPTHLVAVPDLSRHYFGIARKNYGNVRLHGDCDASLLSGSSFSQAVSDLADRMDRNLRLDFVYAKKRFTKHGHPLVDSVVPLLYFLGIDKFWTTDQFDLQTIQDQLDSGLDDTVHLISYHTTASLRSPSVELLQEIWYLLSSITSKNREVTKREALFFLEAGAYNLEHCKVLGLCSVNLIVESLRQELLVTASYTTIAPESFVHARHTKQGRDLIAILQASSALLFTLEDLCNIVQYESTI